MEPLLAGLRAQGYEVYCALEYANWKIGGLTSPEAELKHDLEQIDTSDKLVVLLEEAISAGVQLENGYAFARGKQVEIYQIGKPAWSNTAFSRLNGHEIRSVQDTDDFARQVLEKTS